MTFPRWGFQTAHQAQLHDDFYGTEYACGAQPIHPTERRGPLPCLPPEPTGPWRATLTCPARNHEDGVSFETEIPAEECPLLPRCPRCGNAINPHVWRAP